MKLIVGVEGLPGVGKTTIVADLAEQARLSGWTCTVIPELLLSIPTHRPVPAAAFVANDKAKGDACSRLTSEVVLMDRTWVSTNACEQVLSELGIHGTRALRSPEFAVSVWLFLGADQGRQPQGGFPWTTAGFANRWEGTARSMMRATGAPVLEAPFRGVVTWHRVISAAGGLI